MATDFRTGKISDIDHAAGMVRVTYPDRDNEVTPFFPMLANGEYKMPQVDDQVAVLHFGTGHGVVLGRTWSQKNIPPEGAAGLFRKDLGDEPGQAVIRYDGATLSIQCSGAIKITAGGSVTINGSTIDLN